MDRPQRPQRPQRGPMPNGGVGGNQMENQMNNPMGNQMGNQMNSPMGNQMNRPMQNPNQRGPMQNPNQGMSNANGMQNQQGLQVQNGRINMQKQDNQPINMTKKNAQPNPLDNPNLSPEERVYYMMQEKKRKRKKLILTILGVVGGVAIVGAGLYFITTGRVSSRVRDLETEVEELNQTITDNQAAWSEKAAEYEQQIADTTVKEYLPETSLQRVEASDVPTLWLPEGDFMAPQALEIPGVSETVNDSNVKIGPSFLFKPSDRWMMVSQGTTYEFSHPNRIWGKIKALNITGTVPEESMQEIVKNFFVGYPATTITYRKIFLSAYERGCMGRAVVTVNYEVTNPVEYEEPVEQEVEVDEEYEEVVEVDEPVMQKVTNEDGTMSEVPVMETITNEDGTTTEVQKTQKVKKKQPATRKVKKMTTIMQKKTRDETTTLQKDLTINVGFAYMSDSAISFLFVHETENDASCQELIDSLLKSGYYKTTEYSLKLE